MTNIDIINQNAATPAEAAQKIVKLKELKKQVDAKLKELNNSLLDSMQDLGVLTLKLETLTITRQNRQTVKIENVKALEEYCKRENLYFDVQEVPDEITMNQVKELTKKDKIIDGVEVSNTQFVSIRTTK